ncbi:MAG: protein-glutamate O-methyltransferase CheR [Armatimonadetes bacterium]|nr:protein-glutamate O-methyltransferase CheR [Armatimonadota bacterium]
MQPDETSWNRFYASLKQKTAIDLHLYKPDQMRRRIVSMMESKGIPTLDRFWTLLGSSEAELRWFLDKMAINVTELFRNPEKWDDMRLRVLPELLKVNRSLKIWSAGCSLGAEAHTLAILLDQHFPGNHSILGTDIDISALEQAQRGEFGANEMRGVSAELRAKYFREVDGVWKANAQLSKYLRFRRGDLLADRFDGNFDLIMCRNVVIYFTDPAKDDLYKKFFAALRPGGMLFVGSTERIFDYRNMGYEQPWPFFYQKPSSGEKQQQWRNAS